MEFRDKLGSDGALFNYGFFSEPHLHILYTYWLPSAAGPSGHFRPQTPSQRAGRKNSLYSDSCPKWGAIRTREAGVHFEIELSPKTIGHTCYLRRVKRPD